MWGDGFRVEDTVLALKELTGSSSLIPKRTLEYKIYSQALSPSTLFITLWKTCGGVYVYISV